MWIKNWLLIEENKISESWKWMCVQYKYHCVHAKADQLCYIKLWSRDVSYSVYSLTWHYKFQFHNFFNEKETFMQVDVQIYRHNNNEGEYRPHEDELVRRRSASVLEVKEHAQDRLRDELLKAQNVRLIFLWNSFWGILFHPVELRCNKFEFCQC